MIEHLVKWEIDIEADTPMDAALRAQQIQRSVTSIATVFRVTSRCSDCNKYHSEDTVTIDLQGGSHVEH